MVADPSWVQGGAGELIVPRTLVSKKYTGTPPKPTVIAQRPLIHNTNKPKTAMIEPISRNGSPMVMIPRKPKLIMVSVRTQ
jgi:hypothetical protein